MDDMSGTSRKRPIGVFDSGLGGLTVLKSIRALLPGEDIVYFGDCGRAPYGARTPETIERYTFQDARFLMEFDIKLLVIACNTASAYAYSQLSAALNIPVVDVITPGSRAAADVTVTRRVGVIGTVATIGSGVYERAIAARDPDIKVFSKACPLFVPLVEEGSVWWRHEAAKSIASEYIEAFRGTYIDSLVLGCTHYPILKDVIKAAVNEICKPVELVNPAETVAIEVRRILTKTGMTAGEEDNADGSDKSRGTSSFFTSGGVEKFRILCENILEEPVASKVRWLDIEKYESGLR